MRYLQKAVCYCSACEEDVTLFEAVVYPGASYQTIDPVYEGWSRFVSNGKNVYICPKHTVDLTLFVDGKKLKDLE